MNLINLFLDILLIAFSMATGIIILLFKEIKFKTNDNDILGRALIIISVLKFIALLMTIIMKRGV